MFTRRIFSVCCHIRGLCWFSQTRGLSKLPFTALNGEVNKDTDNYRDKVKIYSEIETNYEQYLKNLDMAVSQKDIERQVKVNKKLLVKDRLGGLLDRNTSFLEFSPFAGMGLAYGDVARGGMVCGIGWISGQAVVIQANDATIKGGTAFPITVKKQLRAQEIANQNQLPCLYLVDSGGAFLPLQAEIFPDEQHGGRVFYNEAIMSSKNIPQVCIVCGSCTAGGAYIPTMADQAVMVNKIGTIFLGGPPLVQAATGEVVTAEDLGGATVHCNVSGCTDYFAETELDAFSITRDIFASLDNQNPIKYEKDFEEPVYDVDELGPLSIHGREKILPVYKIIARLFDASKFHEFKANFGPTLKTGFAFIKGKLVGVVANEGPFTSEAALKGTHFIQLCCQQKTPLIFLQDTFPEVSNDGSLVKDLGKMIAAISCADVTKITIVMGGGFGPTSYAMCGRSMEPNFLFLWPGAQLALDTTENLVTYTMNEDTEKTKLTEKIKGQSSAFYSSARLWDDGVVLPSQTREVLGLCLEALSKRGSTNIPSYPAQSPVLRM